MEVRELKFLLKLAALPDYKGKISELKPTSRTKIADTEKICRRLYDRALVDCQEQVTEFELSSVGKALLKLNLSELPLTTAELTILQACSQGTIAPQKTKVTPAEIRDRIIKSLIARGLITAVTTKIRQVWLTDKGKKYLLTEYTPQGNYPVLSLDLLHNYLCLFRQNTEILELEKDTSVQISSELAAYSFSSAFARKENTFVPTIKDISAMKYPLKTTMSQNSANFVSHLVENGNNSLYSAKVIYNYKTDILANNGEKQLISDEQVLQTICDLDRQLNTNNYLPIFYLREKLQPFLSREELDLALYRLQRQNKLELSSIVESSKYTSEQLQAGIPQNVGGCLFFLIVVFP